MTFHRLHSTQLVQWKDDGHAIEGDDRDRSADAEGRPAHLGAVDCPASCGGDQRARGGPAVCGSTERSGAVMNALLLEAQNLRANNARPAKNFSEGLVRLKRRTGLTWEEMAWALGVDTRQLLRWRRGAMPSGAAMLALVRLAAQAPDGIFDLLGDDFIILLSEQKQEGPGDDNDSHAE